MNLAIIVLAIVIYNNAANQKIGKIKGEKSLLNITAGGWGGCTIFLAIGAIPLYLINRKKLIERAKANPVVLSTTHKAIVSVVLLIVGLASIYVRFFLNTHNG